MEIKPVVMVLVDISGYTPFIRLHKLNLLHAEKIVTDLIEALIESIEAPLKVSKLEGDAVFFYAELGHDPSATAGQVMRQVLRFFELFSATTEDMDRRNICICDSCSATEQLKLKGFVHVGEVAIKRVLHFEELAGEDVIVTHRLTKNSVDADEYLLITEAFCEICPHLPEWTSNAHVEPYEGLGEVPARVYYLRRELAAVRPRTARPPATLGAKFSRIAGLLRYSIPRMMGKAPERTFHHIPGGRA